MEIPILTGNWIDIRIEALGRSKFPVRASFWHIIEDEVHPRIKTFLRLGLMGMEALEVTP